MSGIDWSSLPPIRVPGMGMYILEGRTLVAVDDMMVMLRWRVENPGACQIGLDKIDGVTVSTVFLGQDILRDSDAPVVFETMVFGGPLHLEQWRYTAYDEAEAGHLEMVAQVRIAAAQIKSIAENSGAS